MQSAYFEALVNRRHRVLGRVLHDFCLYDILFLTLAENPIWLEHREPTLADLEEAVVICSLPPERFLRAEAAPRTWRERFDLRWWKLRNAGLGSAGAAAALADFQIYLADFFSPPATWEDEAGEARRLKAPWIQSLAVFLEAHTNMTEREIMTAPVGLMLWKAETLGERLGVSAGEIMSEEEVAVAREQQAGAASAAEEEA